MRHQQAISALSQYQSLQETQSTQINQLQQQLSQQQQTIRGLKQEMQTLKQRSAALSAEHNVDLLSALLLAEQADFALRFLKNKPAAVELLKQAQAGIATSDNANISDAINNLLSQLNSTNSVDDASIIAQLKNVQTLVLQLPEINIPEHKIAFTNPINHFISWNEFWQNLKQIFASLVTVRQTGNKTLLTPEARQLIISALQLLNVQAQTALVSHNQIVFQSSLKQMQSILQQYYAADKSSAVAYLKQNLQQLLQMNIDPDLPDLSGLIKSIKSALSANSMSENAANANNENAAPARQTAPIKTQALPS